MKIRVATISGFASISTVVLAGMLIGGCSSPEVLMERPYIPAASNSDEAVVEKVTEEKVDVDITVPGPAVAAPPAMTTPPVMAPLPGRAVQPADFPPLGPVTAKSITYKVQRGDSFWSIARKFRVSKEELAAYNNVSLKKPLYIGKVLNIPPGGYAAPGEKLPPVKHAKAGKSAKPQQSHKAATTAVSSSAPADGKYTVKRGDTLGGIAHRFGVKLKALAQANNMSKPYAIRIGQKLVIPEGSVKVKSTPAKTAPKKAPAESIESALNAVPVESQSASQPKKPEIKDQSPEDILKTLDVGGGAKNEKAMLEELNLGTVKTRNVGVPSDTTIQAFAAKYGVSVNDVKKYNPDFGADGKIPKGSIVVIPE